TKLFGLHGLFIEAQRRNDPAAARQYAEEAAKASPSLAWAGQAVLEFRCRDGDWSGALAILERNRKGGLVHADAFRRQRAVLLTARALSLKDRDAGTASELAQDAAKLCLGLVPAVALAGRLLAEAGERRKAVRILEAVWRESPPPDIATAYADVIPGASARDRLIRMRLLARLAEAHPESALALANAALEAHEFAEARRSLAPLTAAPTRRVATLMARIETAEHGDSGLAREWMARAVHAAHDPAWTADGVIAETWMPVSPVTGRLDAFQWRVPIADLTPRGSTVEQTPPPYPPPQAGEGRVGALSPAPAPKPAAQLATEATLSPSARPGDQPDGSRAHAPDDPGPGPEQPLEPVPRPAANTARTMRSWFSRAAVK